MVASFVSCDEMVSLAPQAALGATLRRISVRKAASTITMSLAVGWSGAKKVK
jgi:hypothetical protein